MTHGWYRWNVYTEQNGILLVTSGEFHAPAQSGHTIVTDATVNILLSTNFGTNKTDQVPDGWTNTVTHTQPQDATQLFEIRDFKDNRAQWQAQVTDYPLLRHPLNRKALHFDGKLEYAATAILQESLQGINSNAFTVEAWVNPTDASRVYPLACCRLNGTALLALVIDGNDRLTLQIADNATILLQSVTALHPGTFTHIALSIADNQAIFYVNGAPDPTMTVTIPPALLSSLLTLLTQASNLEIEIGRGVDGTCFAGAIKEIRVWNSARTSAQIVAGQFERPVLPVTDLVVYWPCGEDAGLSVQDITGNGNDLRPGGLAQARWPTLIPRQAATLDSHELQPTHALTFANPNDYIELSDDAGDQPRERRTVEMWFKVDDTTITHRKQIIYREGDDQRGLIVYVHNGILYSGGYNLPANESNWPGTWLQTDRLTPGTWHQAALVLDGRTETRPETLQAYMDGQLVGVGQGSQLWQVGRKLSLGGANEAARFHDGLISDAGSHFLAGQIIDLRLWDTARTPIEIGPYLQVPQQPFDAHLVLWLQAQALPLDLKFFDRAATGQVGTLALKRPDQWQPLAALPVYSLPLIGLDEPTLVEIATIKRLKDNLNVPLTQLSTLWYTIKHTGAANGSVLWNQIFNSSGMVQDAWPPYLDQPIRWEIVGNTDRDRKMRSRLMEVLHLALPDLIALVVRLSPGEMIIELESSYLSNLYRLARTSSLLGLSMSDLLLLLDMLGITCVQRLEDFQRVNDRVAWLQQTGLSVAQLDFLANDRQSKLAGPAYDDAAIRDLATSLAAQSKDFLIIASTFVSNQISQSQAIQLFAWLGKSGLIDARGAVTARYSGPGVLNDLAHQPGWDATQLDKVRGEIDTKLAASRDGLDQVVLTGLSGLLGAKSDLTRVATAHLAAKIMDAITFFNLMLSIQDAQPIPPAVVDYLYQLNKILYLVGQFDLSADATRTLLDYPAHFGVKQPMKPDIQDLEHLYTYKALNAAYPGNSDLLLSLLSRADGDTTAITADVLALTGWEPNQLSVLTTYFGASGADRVTWLNRLKQCFDLAATLLVDIDFLIQLTATNHLDYNFYTEQAASLLQVLQAGYDDNTWPGVYQPIHDALAVQQRDGLLGLALQQLGRQYQGRKDADILYEYLLLDVQTGSEVQTSRIVQATASVQLYVQRCLMNLEKGVLPESIPTKEWEWMQNYRVWEANRKVFLYPENYIEPELRTDKTPLFAQLQQDLTQGEMSQATVQKAYIKYLDSFKEIASLKVTGSYLYDPAQDPSRQDQSLVADLSPVLYLVGRTDTDPRTYYYRQFKPNSRQWSPWQKIDMQIPADFVSPVFVFNRLFLFWPEFIKSVKPVDKLASAADRQAGKEVDSQGYLTSHGIRLQENQDIWRASVKYTYFNFDKTWIQPQTYPFFGATGQELSTEQHLRPEWQRVYAQQSFKFVAATNDQQPGTSGGEQQENNAQVLRITPNTDIRVMVPANSIQDQMTWSFWANFTKPINSSTIPAQSVVLLSYDEPQGWVWATVTRNLTPMSTPEEEQKALDDARAANATAIQLQQQANDLRAAAMQKTDEATTLATQATLASSNVDQAKAAAQTDPNNKDFADALKVAQAQEAAAANAAQIAHEQMVNAQNAADAADLKAKQAKTDADTLQAGATALQSQMASRDLKLHIEIGDQDKSIDMTLDYRWQHVAVTFQYENSGYTVSLYKDGVPVAGPVRLASSRIPAQEVLRIGYKASDDSAEMAEFELWSSVRSVNDIDTQKDLRPAPQAGLFRIPLNRIEPGAQMLLVDSKTTNDPNDKGLVFHLAQSVRINVPLPQGKRERLILLYGNQYRSLRDNLEDQNFVLTLIKPPKAAGNLVDYDLDLTLTTLAVTRTDGLSINDYAADGTTTLSRYTPQALRQLKEQASALDTTFGPLFLQYWIDAWSAVSDNSYESINHLLKNLSRHEVSLLDVGNQPGWYILDTGEEQFLIRAERANLKTAGERLRFNIPQQQAALTVGDQIPITMYFEADPELQGPEDASPPFGFTFERLTTRGIYDLSGRLFAGGLDGLLSLTSQRTQEWSFGNYQANPNLVTLLQSFSEPITDKQIYPIDFNGSYGMYYSEIFFHAPFFIANQLNTNQNFADARNWYHYIFNPMAQESSDNGLSNDRYWRYLPFRHLNMQALTQILEDPAALQAYHDDPFDPHAIARLRLVAYQKAIVMKYIDNLIDWGDYLFSQDTRESINEATPLYALAYTLLGPKPVSRPASKFEEAGDYRGLKQQNAGPLPDFLIGSGSGANGGIAPTPHSSAVMTGFCVTENEQFIGYWDRVGDRLFKIRHSQNIEGVFRQLALFQPPINPMDLVRAIAGGRDIGSALAGQAVQVPPYRYLFMIDKARDMASTVIDLGGSLLTALESRDSAALDLLENSQEQQILDLTTDIKKRDLDIAQTTLDALNLSQNALLNNKQRYQSLIDTGWSDQENAAYDLKSDAVIYRALQGVFNSIGEGLGVIPKTNVGTAGAGGSPMITEGFDGQNFGAIPKAIGEAFEAGAEIFDTRSDLAAISGEFQRRAQDWDYEKTLIVQELQQVEKQIASATAELANAQQELVIHYKTIAQNSEIAAFLHSKFSTQDLYSWMVARLSGLYFQAYRLAYDMAKSTERALQFELGTDDSFISFGHWDNLKKGLLASESLLVELNRMDKAFLDRDRRRLQIEKKISLQKTMPTALADLKTKGACEFNLSEVLFDRDFPGHYFRTIKTLGVTINAQVDVIDGIHATLIELGDKVLLQPDADAARFLLNLAGATEPDTSKVRTNWAANQQIVVSHVVDPNKPDGDNGMFADPDFIFDNRYFPFEGTGVVSSWRLELPKDTNRFDFTTIQDVVLNLKYNAKADNGQFREEVRKLVATVK